MPGTSGVPTSYSTTTQLRDYPQWSSPLMVSANRPTPRHDDTDSNKYRRKGLLEGLTRWFRYCSSVILCASVCSSLRQQQRWRSPMDDSGTIFRRYLLLIVLACAVGVLLIVFMTRVGRSIGNRDPSLHWDQVDNVRTGN